MTPPHQLPLRRTRSCRLKDGRSGAAASILLASRWMSMGSRPSSRLAALLQSASWILSGGRSGIGGLAAADSGAAADAAVFRMTAAPRQLHTAAHDVGSACGGNLPCCATQHRGTPARTRLMHSSSASSSRMDYTPALDRGSGQQPQHEAPRLPPISSDRQPHAAQRPINGVPQSQPRQQARAATWVPETEEDRAAAALADCMDALVRSGQPKAAMALFDRGFQVGPAATDSSGIAVHAQRHGNIAGTEQRHQAGKGGEGCISSV